MRCHSQSHSSGMSLATAKIATQAIGINSPLKNRPPAKVPEN